MPYCIVCGQRFWVVTYDDPGEPCACRYEIADEEDVSEDELQDARDHWGELLADYGDER